MNEIQRFNVYGQALDDHEPRGAAHFVRSSDYDALAARLAATECKARVLDEWTTSRVCSDHNGKWPRGDGCLLCENERTHDALVAEKEYSARMESAYRTAHMQAMENGSAANDYKARLAVRDAEYKALLIAHNDLAARLAEAQRDAVRYRQIRTLAGDESFEGWEEPKSPEYFDEIVDCHFGAAASASECRHEWERVMHSNGITTICRKCNAETVDAAKEKP